MGYSFTSNQSLKNLSSASPPTIRFCLHLYFCQVFCLDTLKSRSKFADRGLGLTANLGNIIRTAPPAFGRNFDSGLSLNPR